MDHSTLQRMLRQFRNESVAEVTAITVGVSNATYVVTVENGDRYVIRVLDEQTADSAEAEGRIQHAMARNAMSTPVYLRLGDGQFVGHDDGVAFTVAPFVVGAHPSVVTLELVESFGRRMAQLHDVLDQDEIQLGYNSGQWLDPRSVRLNLTPCDLDTAARLDRLLGPSLSVFEADLPLAVIHGELGTNNVFAEGDEVTRIFDFETAQYGPRLFDVVFTYLSFAYDGDFGPPEVLHRLVAGYNAVARRSLAPGEAEAFDAALGFISTATAAWCFGRGHADYGERFLAAGVSPGIGLLD